MKLEKITNSPKPPSKRQYDDACATAHALDLVGERWALLVIRELMLGPRRFSDLRSNLPGISANVLTQRLKGLEAAGIVVRRKLPPPAATQVYELTEWGYESEPIFQALGRWAARSPMHDPSLPFSAVSLMLSLRTMLDAQKAGTLDARIGFHIGEETYLAHVVQGRIDIRRGTIDSADLVLTGTAPAIARAIYAGHSIVQLEQEGILRTEGNRSLADQFVSLFPLPSKADMPLA
ncbi:winged helix-turn-helix transcriptional regulator [Microvirga puerhi]|uniref:Winged helix-turn-helix transcriptional regulator n=1 Tax=Microvirga puerhi TaxID=2876078 RepID=A0ABS7VNR9_9HYPH|nr:winged helix-turn-helix transcriptional regulator [Microvirga puerhi]MBZ6077192.1 winged helix-turn-helix transcriptional regulator [Microvirga puerhi]